MVFVVVMDNARVTLAGLPVATVLPVQVAPQVSSWTQMVIAQVRN